MRLVERRMFQVKRWPIFLSSILHLPADLEMGEKGTRYKVMEKNPCLISLDFG
jgi:hypothetical protein